MDRYHWLLIFHMGGAFLVIGGSVFSAIFNVIALRSERPSDVVVLYRMIRIAVAAVSVGMPVALIFGVWLVADLDFVKWSNAWVIVALILWVVAGALGGAGGRREAKTREFAERLAAEGDAPSVELRTRMRDPLTLALSWSSGLAVLAILAVMIWKPGA